MPLRKYEHVAAKCNNKCQLETCMLIQNQRKETSAQKSSSARQPRQLAHRSALTQSEECAPESKPKPRRRRRWDTLADTSQSRTILPRTHLDASERLSSIRHTRKYRPHICSFPSVVLDDIIMMRGMLFYVRGMWPADCLRTLVVSLTTNLCGCCYQLVWSLAATT